MQVNGYDRDTHDVVMNTSYELFSTYNEHTEGDMTSRDGLLQMQEIMDAVPDTLRAAVFTEFLNTLRKEGVEFDTTAFQTRIVN